MSERDKPRKFSQKLIDDNEKRYGEEIRAQYGEEVVKRSNAKIQGMSKEQHGELEKLSSELNKTLKAAFHEGDPAGALAQRACDLHRKWLCYFWDNYSKKAHLSVAQMYVDDPRFTAYYDKIAKGCAEFLRDAVLNYCRDEDEGA